MHPALTPTTTPETEVVRLGKAAKFPVAARRGTPKRSAASAWEAWEAGGPTTSGTEFFESVSSWTEGTAAQLLRQPWPAGAKRPTLSEVQARLRHNLGLAAHGEHASYPEALELARRGVIEELRGARRPASLTALEP
jgi:hypothetical protein